MDRTTWVHTFITELERLRPHLRPRTGHASRYAHTLAGQAYDPTVDPIAAARAAHARMGGSSGQEDRPATEQRRGEKGRPS